MVGSSLYLEGVIADEEAPYKRILTHGFIVDEKKRKISKSDETQTADGYVKKYGADLVRLWCLLLITEMMYLFQTIYSNRLSIHTAL